MNYAAKIRLITGVDERGSKEVPITVSLAGFYIDQL